MGKVAVSGAVYNDIDKKKVVLRCISPLDGNFIQESAAHATRDAMVIGVVSLDANFFPGFGIVPSLANCLYVSTNLESWRQLNL